MCKQHMRAVVQAVCGMLNVALQVLGFASFSGHGCRGHENMRWLPESVNRLAQVL